MDVNDEIASLALGFKDVSLLGRRSASFQDSLKNNDINIRYSNSELLAIFKNCGKFEHPLQCPESFKLDLEESEKI
jgi:hypothetical protein